LGLNEFEAQRALDQRAVDLLRPIPVEVGDRAEAPEARLCEQSLLIAFGVVGQFARGEFFQQAARRAPGCRRAARPWRAS